MTRNSLRTGYFITDGGTIAYRPLGWNHSPLVILCDEWFPADKDFIIESHAARLRAGKPNPGDLPPCLLAYHYSRPLPWRCVKLDPKTGARGRPTWHATKALALLEGTS